MPLFETESLVLKSYNLAEADRIVVFFTRDHGVVRGVAKGARRLKSRFGSSLEVFSRVQLEFFQKEERELVSIQQVDLIRSSFNFASSPEFLQTFSYLADLLTAVVPPHDPNEKLYRMLNACIEAADSGASLHSIRFYFELWLLKLAGYLPNWNICDTCKRELDSDETADVQADFHLMCANCRRSRNRQVSTGSHREIFSAAHRLSPLDFSEFVKDRVEDTAEMSGIYKRIISNVIGREVASEKSFAVNF
ncbi:MAG TPA: DNA repair protein RecO [Pyrinomonadaceae bacterium]|nr:DNA repair protein RecO [Pyrinomonadaceae bacterium]